MRRRIFVAAIAAAVLMATAASAQGVQDQLWDAAKAGDTIAIKNAIRDGAKVDSLDTRTSVNGRYALNYAAANNQVGAIQVLLRSGAKIEAQNKTGFSALNHAAEAEAVAAVRELLIQGADPKHATLVGNTPLMTVNMLSQNVEIIDMLNAAEKGVRPKRTGGR